MRGSDKIVPFILSMTDDEKCLPHMTMAYMVADNTRCVKCVLWSAIDRRYVP